MFVDKLWSSTLLNIEKLGMSEEAGMKLTASSSFSHIWFYMSHTYRV